MVVCKFFKQGTCRFGGACKFEHPANLAPQTQHQGQHHTQNRNNSQNFSNNNGSNRNQGNYNSNNNRNQFQSQSQPQNNRFGAIQGANNEYPSGRPRSNNNTSRGPNSQQKRDQQAFGVTHKTLEEDLRYERPQWIMSAYGPGKDAPIQLFGGYPLEQSFEEVRIMHYLALAAGNPQQSAQNELELASQSNHQVDRVLQDLDGALKYLNDGMNTHPNRLDILASSTAPDHRQPSGAFSQPITFRATPEIHQPAPFGQPAPPPTPFGQPSTFHQTNADPGFAASPFGQSTAPQQSGTFSQSPIAASASGLSSFGRQPSIAPFGSNTQPHNQSTFGQVQTSTNQLQQPQQHPPTFGQPSPFAQAPAAQVFGQPSTATFGNATSQIVPGISHQARHATNGEFGGAQSSFQSEPLSGQAQPQQSGSLPFGVAPTTTSGFSQFSGSIKSRPDLMQASSLGATPSAPAIVANPGFGVEAPSTTSNRFSNGDNPEAANQPLPLPNGAATATLEPLTPADVRTYTTRDASNRLMTWRGQPVIYNQAGDPCISVAGGLERLWFPDGAPTASANNNDPSLQYTSELKAAYGYLSHNGMFKDGIMPEIAPQPEWCRWDI